jgi:hypothetical protein
MSPSRALLVLALCLPAHASAQAPQSNPAAAAAGEIAAPGPDDRSFRDTSGYRFPALSRTLRDMQNLAYAVQLRDYCADERVSDEFVKAQLARFSAITGRPETCRTLLDY